MFLEIFVVTIVLWYLVGLLGSCIGFLRFGGLWEKGWKKDPWFGFKLALAGPINLIVAVLLPKI